MPDEPIAVTLLVIDALDALGVPYLIGGSLASAVHGVLRATMDTDLVADLRLEHAEPLARAERDILCRRRIHPRGGPALNARPMLPQPKIRSLPS